MIERRVFRVELLPLSLHVGKRVLRRPPPVEDREAIAHQFAMVDQGPLHLRARSARARNNADFLNIS